MEACLAEAEQIKSDFLKAELIRKQRILGGTSLIMVEFVWIVSWYMGLYIINEKFLIHLTDSRDALQS